MHFVCSPFGSSGDVHPMVGLALALRDRGHRVTMLCNGYFEDLVRGRGLEYVELGTKEDFLLLANRKELWNPLQALQFLYREGVALAMRPHFELLAAYREEGPLIAVSNLFGFGARVAQEKLAIPLVTLHLQPSVMWSDIDPPRIAGVTGPRWMMSGMYNFAERWIVDRAICPSLNAWRSELGLAPMQRLTRWWHSPWCVACLFPEWFAAPQPDWPRGVIQTDFPLWDESDQTPLSAELDAFLQTGTPPIAFTPGSANVFGGRFFEAACDACRRLRRRGLLLTRFSEQLPTTLPDGVLHVPYAPFSRLLPHCGALVSHGGIGSMSQALAAGIPQLIVPLAHDQFDNAHRIARLGVGGSLRHRGINGRRLAQRLSQLLASGVTSEKCRQVAQRFVVGKGTADMAAALERRAETGLLR